MGQPQPSLESTAGHCFACGSQITASHLSVYLYGVWFHLRCYQRENNLPVETGLVPPALGRSSGPAWPTQRLISWITDPGPRSITPATKDPVAVELGRRGGLKGGRARAARLSPARRAAIARRAARARWASAREGSSS